MDNWIELANLHSPQQGYGSQFSSHGDWSATLYRKIKPASQDQILMDIKNQYQLEDEQLEVYDCPSIQTFEGAMNDCRLDVIDVNKFISHFGISEILGYKSIVRDGNTTISSFEDVGYVYVLFHETS